jgi:hypothetical protein
LVVVLFLAVVLVSTACTTKVYVVIPRSTTTTSTTISTVSTLPPFNFKGCTIRRNTAICPNANLVGADLSPWGLALFAGSDLAGANMSNADLSGVDFLLADLSGANLTGANLSDSSLTDANLNGVTWSNTTCPDNSNSNNDGGTCVNNETQSTAP